MVHNMQSRSLGESEKRVVAARQAWRCSACAMVLPAAFQVDHTVPLHLGGEDTTENCTAMCANCHAAKTQMEAIGRRRRAERAATQHEDRVDVCLPNNMLRCAECGETRRDATPHTVCMAIDMPQARALAIGNNLSKFAFKSRSPPPRSGGRCQQQQWSTKEASVLSTNGLPSANSMPCMYLTAVALGGGAARFMSGGKW